MEFFRDLGDKVLYGMLVGGISLSFSMSRLQTYNDHRFNQRDMNRETVYSIVSSERREESLRLAQERLRRTQELPSDKQGEFLQRNPFYPEAEEMRESEYNRLYGGLDESSKPFIVGWRKEEIPKPSDLPGDLEDVFLALSMIGVVCLAAKKGIEYYAEISRQDRSDSS